MVGLVHQRDDIDVIAQFKFVNAPQVLANMPNRVIGDAEGHAQYDMTCHTMGHQRDGFSQMVLAQIAQQFFDAQADLPYGFAAGEFHLARGFHPLSVQVGKFGENVFARHAFPCAVINIQEVRRLFDPDAVQCRERRCRLNGAGQGTGINCVDFNVGKARRDFFRLRESLFV